MISLLKLLPKSLTTFLYAVAALLRFYGNSNSLPRFSFTIVDYSFLAFCLATAALLVNLGLEWYAGNRDANRRAEARERADQERNRAAEEREKADQERDRADQERQRAASRARIQNRWIVLEIQHRFENSPATRSALRNFSVFLQEYGE